MSHEWRQDFQLLDRKVFSRRLKVSKDAVPLKAFGSESQVLGPQKEKDLSSNVRWRDGVYNFAIYFEIRRALP